MFGALEIGGFGVGAESEWSVTAGANYTMSERVDLTFGWRHLEVDYREAGVVFDARQTGPFVGATFKF